MFATLLCLFQHIWTNLLTQCTQCQFLSADVCELQIYTHIYSAQKIPRKIYKKSAFQKTADHRRRAGGGHPPPRRPLARPGVGPRHLAAWVEGATPDAPFGLYLHPVMKTLGRHSVSRFSPLFRRRRDPEIGIARRPCPGTLPEGGSISGSFSTTMSASRMCRE